jgi:DNA-binding FadR family transcriptional regulator
MITGATGAKLESHDTTPTSQTDVVIRGIKRMIVGGRLSAGSRLPIEKDLAEEFGISRGPLREGVRALCIMGVLETRQGDGTYVTSLDASLLLAPMEFLVDLQSPSSGEHLQSVRRILETEAAGRAASRVDDDLIAVLQSILRDVEPPVLAPPIGHVTAMEADMAFHHTIAAASGNPALAALIDALSSRTVRGRTWRALTDSGAQVRTHGEHLAILDAIANGDGERARLHMAVHLLGVEEFMRAHPISADGG